MGERGKGHPPPLQPDRQGGLTCHMTQFISDMKISATEKLCTAQRIRIRNQRKHNIPACRIIEASQESAIQK